MHLPGLTLACALQARAASQHAKAGRPTLHQCLQECSGGGTCVVCHNAWLPIPCSLRAEGRTRLSSAPLGLRPE
eukprot:12140546-Alexandrium_andersonii.AAC.1